MVGHEQQDAGKQRPYYGRLTLREHVIIDNNGERNEADGHLLTSPAPLLDGIARKNMLKKRQPSIVRTPFTRVLGRGGASARILASPNPIFEVIVFKEAFVSVSKYDLFMAQAGQGKPTIILEAGAGEDSELSGLSTKGNHLITEKSGHYIHCDEPELVVEAIHQMVKTIYNES